MFKKNSITQGDSLDLLKKIPDKSIDLIFADPPYNLQLRETLYRPDQTTVEAVTNDCLLYTSPSPRDYAASRMPSSA